MAGDLPPAEPSEGLRERLRAAVEETEQLPRARAPSSRPAAPAGVACPAPPAAVGDLDVRAPLPLRRWTVGRPGAGCCRPRWSPRPSPPCCPWARGTSSSSSDRDAARATAAEQSAMLDALLAPGRAAIAPVTQDGEPVATVVARDDRAQVVAHGLPVNDSHDQIYVLWGMQDDLPQAAGDLRRGHSPDGPADRRLGGDRARRLLRVRDQPRARSGGSVVTDGRRRDKGR